MKKLKVLWRQFFFFCAASIIYAHAMPDRALDHDAYSHTLSEVSENELVYLDDIFPGGIGGGKLPTTIFRSMVTPAQILQTLTDPQVQAEQLLQEEFYLRTTPFNSRDILDLPAFEPYPCATPNHISWCARLFWNKTDRSHFTKSSTCLRTFLALTQETLLEKLENLTNFAGTVCPELKPILDQVDIRTVFSLFETMTIEERRLGFMGIFTHAWETMRIRVLVPLYYRERNFFLRPHEQRRAEEVIEKAFGFQQTPEETERFQKEFFVSDKLGFGDTRLELDGIILQKCHATMRLGLQCTFPTAFAFKEGIRGSEFAKPCSLPPFSFSELFDIVLAACSAEEKKEQVLEIIRPFFLGALKRLSATLIEKGLGNGGHVGLGLFLRNRAFLDSFLRCFACYERVKYHCPLLEHLTWHSRVSLEWLLPSVKRRAFIFESNPALFAQFNFKTTDPIEQAAAVAFLEQEFVRRYYAVFFKTTVNPGIIFHATSKLCYEGSCWDWYLGTDTWVKTADRLSNIQTDCQTVMSLNLKKAEPFWSYQGKLILGITRKIFRDDCTAYFLSLHADQTIASSGIGKDFSLALGFEATF